STGDADRDVQLRRDDFAGLTDLHVVRHEAGVNGRARSANGSAQLVGQRVQVLEVVTIAHTTTAGNDDLRCGQLRTIRLGQLFTNEGRLAGISCACHGFNGGRTTFSSGGIKTGGTYGDHLNGSRRLHGSDGITRIDRTLEGIRAFHGD